jgi:predicted alpha/beta hydrolase
VSAAPGAPEAPVPSALAAPEAVQFAARDGRLLSGLFLAAGTARAALVVNGATGYRQEFYLKFAHYCAQRGYHTLLYDYRGMGASAPPELRTEQARMSDWGMLDMPGALEYLGTRAAALPLFTLGHSVGGQLLGCMPNQARARAHVMIAVSTGYWRRQRVPFRYYALLFWKLYGPLALARHGYVPQGRLWAGDSLPRNVFLQWREWCLRPEHFAGDLSGALGGSQFDAVTAPLLNWGFSDDPIATPAAVAALMQRFYAHAQLEQRWSTPRELGVRAIGHHGFFSERHRDSLWRGVLDWLDARGS